jgi:hypothetical protein
MYGYTCPACEDERLKQEQDELINDLLKKWTWNASIFDIYDELKEDYEDDKEMLTKILSAAHSYFNMDDTKKAIEEIAFHFSVTINTKRGE